MEWANQYVLPGESVKLTGQRYFEAVPQLWTWRRFRDDRAILKLVVREDGEDVVLEGEICDFMESAAV